MNATAPDIDPIQAGYQENVGRVADLLALTRPQKSKLRTASDIHLFIVNGLSGKAVASVYKALGVSIAQFADVLGIGARTYHDLIAKPSIGVTSSDRLYRIAATLVMADEVLGSRELAVDWLNTKLPALANDTPLNRLKTEIGAKRVRQLLLAIEYGFYA